MKTKGIEQLLASVAINIDYNKRDTFATTLHDTLKNVINTLDQIRIGSKFRVPEGDEFEVTEICFQILAETFENNIGLVWGMREEDRLPYNVAITIHVKKVG